MSQRKKAQQRYTFQTKESLVFKITLNSVSQYAFRANMSREKQGELLCRLRYQFCKLEVVWTTRPFQFPFCFTVEARHLTRLVLSHNKISGGFRVCAAVLVVVNSISYRAVLAFCLQPCAFVCTVVANSCCRAAHWNWKSDQFGVPQPLQQSLGSEHACTPCLGWLDTMAARDKSTVHHTLFSLCRTFPPPSARYRTSGNSTWREPGP